MSLLDSIEPAAFSASGEHTGSLATAPAALMNEYDQASEKSELVGLAAHEDARALVRLVQCRQCSRPFRSPVVLPCGNTLCRECLPETREREGTVSWPDLALRRLVIKCPFVECGLEHPDTDYAVDVVMNKIMESIAEAVARHTSTLTNETTTVEELVRWDEDATALEKSRIHTLPGGRLIAAYTLAAQGNLDYRTDLEFQDDIEGSAAQRALDVSLLQDLVDSTQREMDCQVCYRPMLDPVTTYCGHTLCRKCMARVLDHSSYCPVCRRRMTMAAALARQESNKVLGSVLESLCPETVAARTAAAAVEGLAGSGELNVPLFVCTLAFPHQPTFLRIFEPRYRLMLRRCLEGDREFGMLMYNRYQEPQGDLGPVRFYHYGTMLHITDSELLPDGTSLIETRGVYRFRVLAHGELDGYMIGKVERLEDMPLAEEERLEAEEIARPLEGEGTLQEQIDHMSTEELIATGREFIARMQETSAIWLQQRVLAVHGQLPDDAALFPYWFAAVLPISEEEKYKLLGTRSVRERLKITVSWIRRVQTQRWRYSIYLD